MPPRRRRSSLVDTEMGANPACVRPEALQISARMARRVPLLATALGLDAQELCRNYGINQHALADPHARVALDPVLSALEGIWRATAHPALGLALARCAEPDSYATPALILLASTSLAEGFTRAFQFQRLWGDGQRFTFLSEPELGGAGAEQAVAFRVPGPRRLGHAILEVCALAETALAVRYLTGQLGARARHLCLPTQNDDPARLLEHFGVEPRFGSELAYVSFDSELLAAPLPHANALFLGIFERQAERELESLPALDDLQARVRAEIAQGLARGRFALPDCARALGLSSRTLERRLTELGSTYQELIEAVRKPLALQLLGEGRPVEEVALLLGYSERSPFHRACVRWFQKTPAELRAVPSAAREHAPSGAPRGSTGSA